MRIGQKVNVLHKQENGAWVDIINGGQVISLTTTHAKVWDAKGEHNGTPQNAEWFSLSAPSCRVEARP